MREHLQVCNEWYTASVCKKPELNEEGRIMSEKISIVLSDVDGTQTKPFEPLPSPAVQAAAHALRANGVHLSEVTSRPHGMIKKLVTPLALQDNLCCLDGGATIARADSGDVVWSSWLSAETKRDIVRSIGGFCARIQYDLPTRKQDPAEVLASIDDGPAAHKKAPSIFAVFKADHSSELLEALSCVPQIQHTPLLAYDRDPSMRCIQIVAPGVDKQSGALRTLIYADQTSDRALAIGDGANDLALFHAVGTDGVKIALNNADTPDELKDLADWVAPSVQEDGFAVAMQRYELI